MDHAFIERMPSFLMKDPFQKRIRSVVALLKLRSDKVRKSNPDLTVT